mmetsp:Transcript_17575/g.38408  ORF Transcript_17575/g.38408 Transcript_17575/m.38408 type:complete len:214 (+) Transcript_17575:1068-1709(+)
MLLYFCFRRSACKRQNPFADDHTFQPLSWFVTCGTFVAVVVVVVAVTVAMVCFGIAVAPQHFDPERDGRTIGSWWIDHVGSQFQMPRGRGLIGHLESLAFHIYPITTAVATGSIGNFRELLPRHSLAQTFHENCLKSSVQSAKSIRVIRSESKGCRHVARLSKGIHNARVMIWFGVAAAAIAVVHATVAVVVQIWPNIPQKKIQKPHPHRRHH